MNTNFFSKIEKYCQDFILIYNQNFARWCCILWTKTLLNWIYDDPKPNDWKCYDPKYYDSKWYDYNFYYPKWYDPKIILYENIILLNIFMT